MSRYKYEVDKDNAIRVWDNENPNENDAPFFFQPDWPNETPWASKAEAEDWAKLFVESLENPESEYVPGPSADKHPMLRPEPEVVEAELEAEQEQE